MTPSRPLAAVTLLLPLPRSPPAARRRRRADPRGGAGRGEDRARPTPRGAPRPRDRRAARPASTGCSPPTASAPTPRRSRATSRCPPAGSPPGGKVIAVDGTVYGGAAVHHRVRRDRPGRLHRARPGRADGPRRRPVLAAHRGRGRSPPARSSATARRCSAPSAAPCPATWSPAVIPSADADAGLRRDLHPRRRRPALHEAVLTGPFYPKAGDVTYTIDFDHYGTATDISAP